MPQTCERLEECREEFDNISEALFGNEKLKQKGLVEMVQEMHDVFYPSTILLKVTKWLIMAIITFSGLVYGIYRVWELIKK